jgi:hypothetical protein
VANIDGFGMEATNQNYTNKEIKSEVNQRNGFLLFNSQSFVSSLPSKNVRIKMYRIIILLVMCGFRYWFVTFREEHRLWVSENRVLRNMLGPKEDEETEGWKKLCSDLYYLPNTVVMVKLTL